MFLPTTAAELKSLGWKQPDIILVTGDTYIDSPQIGAAVIGKYLWKHGFKTALIAQPAVGDGRDITRLGAPALFWGVTAGSIDSMVANFTRLNKFRHQDDYTPGGVNVRPNRATIVYTNLIRQHFKPAQPIVLGGIEASLRRIAHYDCWDDAVRRSLLFDAKADILAYGMAEKTVLELAAAFRNGADWRNIKGICYIASTPAEGNILLPSFDEVAAHKPAFRRMSMLFDQHADHPSPGFIQQHGDRFLIHNPPPPSLSTAELDEVSDLEFAGDAHPYYKTGEIRALATIKQSITTHRGCIGQCNFCAIAVHQGRQVVSRSPQSIMAEASRISQAAGFNGIIYDVGGPTANMYGLSCRKGWACQNKHCLMPKICPQLGFGHRAQMEILRRLLGLTGIKKVFVASGIRPDLVMADQEQGRRYIAQLAKHHVSGQIKLAPEHSELAVLKLMNKPAPESLIKFKDAFDSACAASDKSYYMTYYLMAAHPGCTKEHMQRLKSFLASGLKTTPEQVQIFTPTPATLSTAMYHCETDMAGNKIFCEKNLQAMQKQKELIRSRHTGRGSN
ncbi:MAG: YgiQ family radical SAM protein [Syntrophales bacterium]